MIIPIAQIQKVISGAFSKTEQSIACWFNAAVDGSSTPRQPIVNSAGQLQVQASITGGTSTAVNVAAVGGTTYALGSNVSAVSMPFTLATDSPFLSSGFVKTIASGMSTAMNIMAIGGTSFTLGLKSAGNCIPVVLASDRRLRDVSTADMFAGESISSAVTATSDAVDVSACSNFSVQYSMTTAGSKNVTLGYTCSLDNITYYTPTGGGTIDTVTADGFTSFAPPLTKYMKLVATNNAAATVTLNCIVGAQVE